MASISYCISVADEHVELDRLLDQLSTHIQGDDELIILVDESKVTAEVSQVISKWRLAISTIKLIGAPLNKNFGEFKNNFLKETKCEFIFQIDTDELLSEDLLVDLKLILDVNPEVDLYWLVRENYVDGLTPEHIQRWRWNVDEKGRINYKDPQARIFRNNGNIRWIKPVHEQIVGHKQFAILPDNYFLIHRKSIERQEKQNDFYNTL